MQNEIKNKLCEDLMDAERSRDVLKVLKNIKLLPNDAKLVDDKVYVGKDFINSEYIQHWMAHGNSFRRNSRMVVQGQGRNPVAAIREKLTNMFDAHLVTAAIKKGVSVHQLERENYNIKQVINEFSKLL